MKKIAMVFSGIILILGCLILGISLLLSSILPNAFLVYLTANPVSFGHDILQPNMTGPYVFSIIEIVAGVVGIIYWGRKSRD